MLLDLRIPVPIWFLILCTWPVFFHQGTFTMFSFTPVFWKFTLLYLGVSLLSLIIPNTVGPLSIGTHSLRFWRIFLTFLWSFLSFSFFFLQCLWFRYVPVCSVTLVVSNSLQTHGLRPPGSSVLPGILQARMLEWVAMPFSKGSPWPRDRTCISYVFCIGRQVLYH